MSGLPVLGIDPSLRATGLAKYEAGRVETLRLDAVVGEGLEGIRRTVRYIVGRTLQWAPQECLTVIESPIVARGGRGGMQLERAWLFGLLFDQLFLRGPIATVHPMTRALYATGNGRAEKDAVVVAMKAAFPRVLNDDHNIADALALLGMGARWQGAPIDGHVTSKQLKAMRSAHWPGEEGTR